MILEALAEAVIDTPAPPVQHSVTIPADRSPRPSRAQLRTVAAAAAVLPARWAAFGRCVETRESHSNPRAVNPSSGAAGVFQFMPAWRRGLPFIVARGLKRVGATPAHARWVREHLPYRIEEWPEMYQRVGFAQVIHEGGASAAFRHWQGGGGCNSLVAW